MGRPTASDQHPPIPSRDKRVRGLGTSAILLVLGLTSLGPKSPHGLGSEEADRSVIARLDPDVVARLQGEVVNQSFRDDHLILRRQGEGSVRDRHGPKLGTRFNLFNLLYARVYHRFRTDPSPCGRLGPSSPPGLTGGFPLSGRRRRYRHRRGPLLRGRVREPWLQRFQDVHAGCVIVPAREWPRVFDELLDFRRWVRASFGVLLHDEIKASDLVRNTGDLAKHNLGDGLRRSIYRQHMRVAEKIGLEVFAVVIVKGRIIKTTWDPRDVAWDFLFQRIERRSTKANEPAMLIHDEGDDAIVRKLSRKARRAGIAGSAFGLNPLKRPATWLIDDPVSRRSDYNFLIQMADLAAYAGYTRIMGPTQKTGKVCPQTMWDELGAARYAPANQLKGGVPGIVEWPDP